jgi:hypothetical protein
MLRAGQSLVVDDLGAKSPQDLAELNKIGTRIVVNNANKLQAKAEVEQRAREAAAAEKARAADALTQNGDGPSVIIEQIVETPGSSAAPVRVQLESKPYDAPPAFGGGPDASRAVTVRAPTEEGSIVKRFLPSMRRDSQVIANVPSGLTKLDGSPVTLSYDAANGRAYWNLGEGNVLREIPPQYKPQLTLKQAAMADSNNPFAKGPRLPDVLDDVATFKQLEIAGQFIQSQAGALKQGYNALQAGVRADAAERGGVLGYVENNVADTVDVLAGAVMGASDAVGGASKLVYNAGQLVNPAEWLLNPENNVSRANTTARALDTLGSVVSPTQWVLNTQETAAKASALWDGISHPYREGTGLQGVGRGVFDVASLLAGVGQARAALKAGEAAGAVDKAADATRALDELPPALKDGADEPATFDSAGRTPRTEATHVLDQRYADKGCGAVACAMVLKTMGKDAAADDLLTLADAVSPSGMQAKDLVSWLREAGVDASYKRHLSMEQLAAATSKGYPAVVGVWSNPRNGHAVVIDYVTTKTNDVPNFITSLPEPVPVFAIRDPARSPYFQKVSEFEKWFFAHGQEAIVIEGTLGDGAVAAEKLGVRLRHDLAEAARLREAGVGPVAARTDETARGAGAAELRSVGAIPGEEFALVEVNGRAVKIFPNVYRSLFHGTDKFSLGYADEVSLEQVAADIYSLGLPGRGQNINLAHHADGLFDSAFRGGTIAAQSPTADVRFGAVMWAESGGEAGGLVIKVRNVRGYDVNVTLEGRIEVPGGYRSAYMSGELEHAFPALTRPDQIDTVYRLKYSQSGRWLLIEIPRPTSLLGAADNTGAAAKAADAMGAAKVADDAPQLYLLDARVASQRIAAGHAFDEHVLRGEFAGLGIFTPERFARHIEKVISSPTASRRLDDGRAAYWHKPTGTVVIVDPRAPDLGTAFQPIEGRAYFDQLNK